MRATLLRQPPEPTSLQHVEGVKQTDECKTRLLKMQMRVKEAKEPCKCGHLPPVPRVCAVLPRSNATIADASLWTTPLHATTNCMPTGAHPRSGSCYSKPNPKSECDCYATAGLNARVATSDSTSWSWPSCTRKCVSLSNQILCQHSSLTLTLPHCYPILKLTWRRPDWKYCNVQRLRRS